MSWWHALILGIVQGLTEFFPVSSSGHLELVPWLFGWDHFASESAATAFDAALHLGTLVAVMIAVRAELSSLAVAGIRHPFMGTQARRADSNGRLAWLVLLTAVPAALVGVAFDEAISESLGGPIVVALSLIGFGALLWWADRRPGVKISGDLTLRDAWLVGVAQILALNPGTSRSGITISAMRMLGYERAAAVRMSFVMGVPIIGGAGLYKLASLVVDGVPDGFLSAMVVGVCASAITGWLAINALQRLAARSNFNVFVIYRVVLGLVVLNLAVTGLR